MAKLEQAKRDASRYVIFIGHLGGDTFLARMIADRIRELGGEPWLDHEQISGGETIYERILDGANGCDEAVVLVSPHATTSVWIPFEIGMICGKGKRITPILVHVDVASIPIILGVKAIELNQLELFLSELRSRILSKKDRRRALERGKRSRSGTQKKYPGGR